MSGLSDGKRAVIMQDLRRQASNKKTLKLNDAL
jgi:hypothetical protein